MTDLDKVNSRRGRHDNRSDAQHNIERGVGCEGYGTVKGGSSTLSRLHFVQGRRARTRPPTCVFASCGAKTFSVLDRSSTTRGTAIAKSQKLRRNNLADFYGSLATQRVQEWVAGRQAPPGQVRAQKVRLARLALRRNRSEPAPGQSGSSATAPPTPPARRLLASPIHRTPLIRPPPVSTAAGDCGDPSTAIRTADNAQAPTARYMEGPAEHVTRPAEPVAKPSWPGSSGSDAENPVATSAAVVSPTADAVRRTRRGISPHR